MRAAKRIGIALAALIAALLLLNASWFAPSPGGTLKLIAHRGVYQPYDNSNLGRDDCTATRIEPPVHDFQENTVASINEAFRTGATMVEVDIAPTTDKQIVLFHDWTVDCRTEASGNTRDFTLAELQSLDIGHGYSADGGQTFPFRGRFQGAMPTLAEGMAAAPDGRFIFNFKSKNPEEADLLVAQLAAAGRPVDTRHDAFYGGEGPVRRIKELFPDAWAFTTWDAKECSQDYALLGWLGIVPDSCRKSGTIFVALDYQWVMPGWPNRMIKRMDEAGVQIIVIGPISHENAPRGVDLPEHLEAVPDSFNGWLWVDDMYSVGPAFRPESNARSAEEEAALAQALDRRRATRQ